jgi:hypothetical protein
MDPIRIGEGHPLHPPLAPGPSHAGHPLLFVRGQGHPCRAEAPGAVCPLPCGRTVERVLKRNGLTAPQVRLTPLLPRQEYPAGKPGSSNQLHQVDPVAAFYLKGAATASRTGWARTPWTPSMAPSASNWPARAA